MIDEQVAFVGGPMAVAQVLSVFALPHIQGWCVGILMCLPHHPVTTFSDHACDNTCKQINGRLPPKTSVHGAHDHACSIVP
jgi:hypothetical protein